MKDTNDKTYCVYAHINKINGKIYNVLYPSMREAERQTGISRQNIYSSLKTKGTAGGYRWRYADNENSKPNKQTN